MEHRIPPRWVRTVRWVPWIMVICLVAAGGAAWRMKDALPETPLGIATRSLRRHGVDPAYIRDVVTSPSELFGVARVRDADALIGRASHLWLVGLASPPSCRRLTDTAGMYRNIVWSDDERSLAYLGYESRLVANLKPAPRERDRPPSTPTSARLGADDGNAWKVTLHIQQRDQGPARVGFETIVARGQDAGPLSWVAGAPVVLFGAASPAGLYMIRAAAPSNPVRLSASPPVHIDARAGLAVWYDDRARLTTVRRIPVDQASVVTPEGWQSAPRTGEFRLPEAPDSFAASSDGRRLAFFLPAWGGSRWYKPYQLVVVDLQTEQVRLAGTLSTYATGLRWAADARTLHFRMSKGASEFEDVQTTVDVFPPTPLTSVNWRSEAPARVTPSTYRPS